MVEEGKTLQTFDNFIWANNNVIDDVSKQKKVKISTEYMIKNVS